MVERGGSRQYGSARRRSHSVRSSRSERRASRTFERSILGERSGMAGAIAESASAEGVRRSDAISASQESNLNDLSPHRGYNEMN